MATSRRTPEELRQIIAEKIPEGTVTPEHTVDAHWYRHIPSGILLPSVTGITGVVGSEHLKTWAANLTTDYIEERFEYFRSMNDSQRQEVYKAAILAHKDTLADAGGIGTDGHGVAEAYLNKWIETGIRPDDITKFITGDDYRLWAIARSVQKFCKDYFAIPVASEQKVAHVWGKGENQTGYAGTLDALMYLAIPCGNIDSKCEHDIYSGSVRWDKITCLKCKGTWQYELCLVDFKTSNSIWKFPTPEGMLKMIKDEYCQQVTAYWRALKWMTGIAPKRIIVVRLDKSVEKYEIGEVFDRTGHYKAFLGLFAAYKHIHAQHQKSATLAVKERVSIENL